jgi:four helix bundle protein
MSVKSYRELEVWQLSMELSEAVYAVVGELPSSERFALSDQLRRAVVSIPSNIAEGFGRNTTKDFLHYLSMARGSLCEVDTQLELASRIWRVPVTELNKMIERVGMMLNALSTKLKNRMSSNAPITSHESRDTNCEHD